VLLKDVLERIVPFHPNEETMSAVKSPAAEPKTQTLKDVVFGNQDGFQLKIGYWLEIDHSLMGYFPAIIEETTEIILTFDPVFLKDVWQILEPKSSKMVEALFYVNEEKSLAFALLANPMQETLGRIGWHVLTRQEFDQRFADNKAAFRWAPGIFGALISPERYRIIIEDSMRKITRA
jgi:hypothetical protein